MAKCALFIDYENVFKSLQGRNINLAHRQLAELFKTEATKVGEVIYARAYAPWDIWPDAMSAFDRQDIKPEYVEGGHKDNADLVMSLQIQDFLHIWRAFGREEADTFIVVTGDAGFVHVIKKLQEENKRVIVWGVEGSISNRLSARVPELVNVQLLLQEHGLLPASVVISPSAEAPVSETAVGTVDYRLRGLVLLCERIMLERGWVQVPFLTLQEQLSASHFYGENLPQCRTLIMTGLDLEMLETKKQPNPKRPGTETTFVLLRKENAAIAQTLRITQELVAVVRQMIARQGRPAVAVATLLSAFAESDLLATEGQGDAEWSSWIDLLVEQTILRRARGEGGGEPHVTLNEMHSLVEQVVPGEDLWPTLIRLVLVLDHYLTRTGYLWMSMGLLRQQLGGVGQREMERAVRVAIEQGIVVVRQQSNQYGARPTTGAYLQQGNEQVEAVLALRNRVLDQLLLACQGADEIPRLTVVEILEAVLVTENASEWLELFIAHQLLNRLPLTDGVEELGLNRQHPVVVRRAAHLV